MNKPITFGKAVEKLLASSPIPKFTSFDQSLDMDMMNSPLENHPQYPALLKAIEQWGDKPKGILITEVYDLSGNGLTRHELRQMERGTLLAVLIDKIVVTEL